MKKRKVRVFIVVSLIISFVLTQTFTSFGDELPNGSYRLIKAYDFEGQDLEVDLGDKECEPWTVREYDKDSDRASKYSKRYLSCEYQNIIGENPEEESFDMTLEDGGWMDIPSRGNPAIAFYMYIDNTSVWANDYLEIRIDDGDTISEVSCKFKRNQPSFEKSKGWKQYFYDLSAYKGEKIKIMFTPIFDTKTEQSRELKLDDIGLVDMKISPVDVSWNDKTFYDGDELPMLVRTGGTDRQDILIQKNISNEAPSKFDPTYEEGQRLSDDDIGKDLVFQASIRGTELTSAITMGKISKRRCYNPVITENNDGTYSIYCKSKNVKIYYKINDDQSIRTTGKLYGGEKITLKNLDIINAKAYPEDTNISNSDIVSIVKTGKYSPNIKTSIPTKKVIRAGTKIRLSCEKKYDIYYTINGTGPKETENGIEGNLYNKPIPIDEDVIIIAVSAKNGKITGRQCSFRYKVEKRDQYENNNTKLTATKITLPSKVKGSITNPLDKDYYSFVLKKCSKISTRFSYDTSKLGDYSISLISSKGKVIKKVSARKEYGFTAYLDKGKYYIKVDGKGGEYILWTSLPAETQEYDFSEKNLSTTLQHQDSPYVMSPSVSLNTGGHYLMSLAYLSAWKGPVLEEDDPYIGTIEAINEDGYSVNEKVVDYKKLSPKFHVQNAIFLDPVVDRNKKGVEHIKHAVRTYGALHVDYDDNQNYYNMDMDGHCYYYMPFKESESNHAVTIVGYNDSLPKEKFKTPQGYMPKEDGGFILKNSWGEEWGDHGYFYMSYESYGAFLNPPTIYFADENVNNYNTIYLYDDLGAITIMEAAEDILYEKNVFHTKDEEVLKAISFYNVDSTQTYDFYVKIGGEKPKFVATIKKDNGGYYTVNIKDIVIPENTDFEIIMRTKAIKGQKAITAVEAAIKDYSENALFDKGQSFNSYDGNNWRDIGDENHMNSCLKAFTVNNKLKEDESREGVIFKGYKVTPDDEDEIDGSVGKDGAIFHCNIKQPLKGIGTCDKKQINMKNPKAFDLRDLGAVTPVKNQGYLGTCWAFSTIASLESTLILSGNGAF